MRREQLIKEAFKLWKRYKTTTWRYLEIANELGMSNTDLEGTMNRKRALVLLKTGQRRMSVVHFYQGGCMIGDPTAYIVIDGETRWVVPGESVEFVEV